jgi:acyl-CoA thioester hydrolase
MSQSMAETNPLAPDYWTETITVSEADIDVLGHVNNVVYVRWAQDLATAHWSARAPEEMQQRYIWVVTRHEIDYRAEIKMGDRVTGVTWVDEAGRGPLFGRTVEVRVEGRAKPAATVRSMWCLVDAATRKIQRVPADVSGVFWPDR